MTKSKWLLVIGLLALAALASLQLLRSRGPRNREPFLAEVPMADGIHRLRLLKIVEGPMVYDWKDPTPPLLRMLPLPAKFRPPYVPFAKVTSDGVMRGFAMGGADVPVINFLFRVVDSKGEYAAHHLGVPEMTLIESTGHRFEKPFQHFDHAVWGVVNFQRSVAPRRDRMLKVEVQLKGVSSQPLVFEVENPLSRPPAEEWVPEPLPATKQFNGIDVTLRSPGAVGFGGQMMNVDVRTNGRGLSPDFMSSWIEDVTGNRGEGLSPFEPAWKLHAKLTPWQMDAVPADRIWAIEDVDVPPLGKKTPLHLEREIDGVTLRLATIVGGAVGSGEKNNRADGPSGPSGLLPDCPQLHLTAKSTHADFDVVVRVTHNQQSLLINGNTARSPLARDITSVFKKLPADSKVKIEIGVGRPIDVEFLVDPEEFKSPQRIEGGTIKKK